MHHEKRIHREFLAFDRMHQFPDGLRKRITVLIFLEGIAAVEKFVLGEVNHHLPL